MPNGDRDKCWEHARFNFEYILMVYNRVVQVWLPLHLHHICYCNSKGVAVAIKICISFYGHCGK